MRNILPYWSLLHEFNMFLRLQAFPWHTNKDAAHTAAARQGSPRELCHPSTLTAVEYIVSTVQKRMQMPATWDSRVLVVKSATGSGKSSVMPVELFRLLRNPQFSGPMYTGRSVLCTQPRVITARDLAETQIAKAPYYPDMQLEDTVGYRTGEFKTEKTRHMLLYATIGAFRQILINQTDEEIRDSYQFIIVDEAHERSLDTDLTLMEIKYFMQRNMGRDDLPMLILYVRNHRRAQVRPILQRRRRLHHHGRGLYVPHPGALGRGRGQHRGRRRRQGHRNP